MKIPFITAADVERHLEWNDVADAIAAGHRRPRAEIGDTFLTRGADTLLSRSAWIDGLGIAVKSVTVMPGNAAHGLPSVQGVMLLFDDDTGAPRAIIDSGLVTKWKTAADSILGAQILARPDAGRLLIIGSGAVAETLIEAYRAVFPVIEISIWNRTADRARALADKHDVALAPDLAAAVTEADIISTCTMATAPILQGEWLRPGQHLDLIGAFKPDMREADDACLKRARIFVDSYDTTLDHIGELKDPLERGVIARTDVLGDLHALVDGTAGRESPEDITLYKNGGGAHLDLLTGHAILDVWNP